MELPGNEADGTKVVAMIRLRTYSNKCRQHPDHESATGAMLFLRIFEIVCLYYHLRNVIDQKTLFKTHGNSHEYLFGEYFQQTSAVASRQQKDDKSGNYLRHERQRHFLDLRERLNKCDAYADNHCGTHNWASEHNRQPDSLLNELKCITFCHDDMGYPIDTPAVIGT